jgi:hypothetical protein
MAPLERLHPLAVAFLHLNVHHHARRPAANSSMIGATVLGVMLVPVFYVVVRSLLSDKSDGTEAAEGKEETIKPFD